MMPLCSLAKQQSEYFADYCREPQGAEGTKSERHGSVHFADYCREPLGVEGTKFETWLENISKRAQSP